jgi:hypothetical protein
MPVRNAVKRLRDTEKTSIGNSDVSKKYGKSRASVIPTFGEIRGNANLTSNDVGRSAAKARLPDFVRPARL